MKPFTPERLVSARALATSGRISYVRLELADACDAIEALTAERDAALVELAAAEHSGAPANEGLKRGKPPTPKHSRLEPVRRLTGRVG